MGWDAESSAEKDWENLKLKDPTIDRIFVNAVKEVKEWVGSVDGNLRIAGLDCSDCAKMLQQATGRSVWTEKPWNADEVKELQKKANWDFSYQIEEAWAYWSARKFLEACAKANLSIRFSF